MALFHRKAKLNAPSDDLYNEEVIPAGSISSHNKITIGVAGITSHIGTTTQALQLALYLLFDQKSVAYVEMNDTGFIEALEESYQDVHRDSNGNAVYERITLVRREDLSTVMGKGYDYLVFDYGSIRSKKFDPASYCERNVQVLVCGSSPQEYRLTTAALSRKEFRKARLLFNFVPKEDRASVEERMTTRIRDTFFTAYTPDPFISNPDMDNVYHQIIPPDPRQAVKKPAAAGQAAAAENEE